MKNTKKIIALFLSLLMLFTFAACSEDKETTNPTPTDTGAAKSNIRITALKGPTGMGLAKLITDSKAGTTENNYTVTIESDPTLVSPLVLKGDFDIAALPTNLAATLFNKNADMQVIALNTMGVLYFLENGNTITDVKSLKGKTIYATGQASTPEYILNYVLRGNGLEPGKDVTVTYFTDHQELVTQLVSNKVAIGMLPQPNVTTAMTKNADLRIALNMTEEFNKVSGSKADIYQGCVVASKKLIAENPEAVKTFLAEYKASVEYVNNNVDEAAKMVADAGILPAEAIAKKAIPTCNICFVSGAEMKTELNAFLQILFDADPKSIGGKMPSDSLYYIG